MELKDFVSETLIQIVEGVAAAAGRVSELKGAVSPEHGSPEEILGLTMDGKSRAVRAVRFDVAVVAVSDSSAEAGAGFKISVLSLGVKGKVSGRDEVTSRIQFVVPLQLPVDPVSEQVSGENRRAANASTQASIDKIRSKRRIA